METLTIKEQKKAEIFRKEYCEKNGLNYIKPENSNLHDYILYLEKRLLNTIK